MAFIMASLLSIISLSVLLPSLQLSTFCFVLKDGVVVLVQVKMRPFVDAKGYICRYPSTRP